MTKLYNHILAPLDGSKLAELTLTDTLALAKLNHAEITLLHVIPPIEEVLYIEDHPILVDEQWDIKKDQALKYLNGICEQINEPTLTIHTAVEMGPPATTIIEYVHRHATIDLIVMAAHGQSGLQRWFLGSVVDRVLRGAEQSVLLIRTHNRG